MATSIRKLNENSIPVFIFSNQAVLAKKKITKLNFKKIIIYLDNYLSKHNAYMDDYLYCPYFNKKNLILVLILILVNTENQILG